MSCFVEGTGRAPLSIAVKVKELICRMEQEIR